MANNNTPVSFASLQYYLTNYAPDLHMDENDKTSIISQESSVTIKGYYIKAINFNLRYVVLSTEFVATTDLIHDSVTDINGSQWVESIEEGTFDFPQSAIFNLVLAGVPCYHIALNRIDDSNAWRWQGDPLPFTVWEGGGEDWGMDKAFNDYENKVHQGRLVEKANYIWTIATEKADLINWGTMQGQVLDVKEQTFAFGHNAKALQSGAFAVGEDALAQGMNSTAFGHATVADKCAFAAGYGNVALGDYSFATGGQNIAKGIASIATGNHTRAVGDYSSASGRSAIAEGHSAHAEGWASVTGIAPFEADLNSDMSIGYFAHAEGNHTRAYGNSSHAEGRNSESQGVASHAEGWQTLASGNRSHSEGSGTRAEGFAAHAEGHQTIASGQGAHAEGARYVDGENVEYYTTASAEGAHAEGRATTASGDAAHAEGDRTVASGSYSHAEGSSNTVSAYAGHAEGSNNTVEGTRAHAEGRGNKAIGEYSHAEGNSTEANGARSHAEGSQTKANGYASHASGRGTIASGTGQMATGNYNKENKSALFIVGNGTGPEDEKRSNAFEVTQDTVKAFGKDVIIVPAITTMDNGKVLQVKNGAWSVDTLSGLEFVGSVELNGFSFNLLDDYGEALVNVTLGDLNANYIQCTKADWESGNVLFSDYNQTLHNLILNSDVVYITMHAAYSDPMGSPITWSLFGGVGSCAQFYGDYSNTHICNSLISYTNDGSDSCVKFSGDFLKNLVKWYDYDNWDPNNFQEVSTPFQKFIIQGYKLK